MAAPKEFRVTVEPDGDAVVVRVAGDLDMSSAERLTEALTKTGSTATMVVADLAGVTFMDSSAVSALVASARTLTAEGSRLALGPRSDVVARVLEITGLAEGTDDFDVQADPTDRSSDG